MSIIAAAKVGGRVAIASDSMTSTARRCFDERNLVDPGKVVLLGNLCVGFVGEPDSKHAFELMFRQKPELFDFSSRSAAFQSLLAQWEVLHQQFHARSSDGDAWKRIDLSMIIATPSTIFLVTSGRIILETSRMAVIGSGGCEALGAMHVLEKAGASAGEVVRGGVQAACRLEASCGGAIVSHELD